MSATITERTGGDSITESVRHMACGPCYPGLGVGYVATAYCGAKFTIVHGRAKGVLPPNACVVCVDLRRSHNQANH